MARKPIKPPGHPVGKPLTVAEMMRLADVTAEDVAAAASEWAGKAPKKVRRLMVPRRRKK